MNVISTVMPPQGLADLESFRAQRSERAYKAFEAMFLQILLEEMRRTVPNDGGLFPKSPAMETFEEMLDAAVAQGMADSGQLGIAKQLAEEAARQHAGAALRLEREAGQSGADPLKTALVSADNP